MGAENLCPMMAACCARKYGAYAKLLQGTPSSHWWAQATPPSLTSCSSVCESLRQEQDQLISIGHFTLSTSLLTFYSSMVALFWAFTWNPNIFRLCAHSEKSYIHLSPRPPYHQLSNFVPFRHLTTSSVNPFSGSIYLSKTAKFAA